MKRTALILLAAAVVAVASYLVFWPRVPDPWAARFGDDKAQWAQKVAYDGGGSALVAGVVTGTFELAGQRHGRGSAANDVFVASFSDSGKPQWARVFGNEASQGARQLRVDGDQNAYLLISSVRSATAAGIAVKGLSIDDTFHPLTGPLQTVLVKLDAAGNVRWSRSFGTAQMSGLAVDRDGSAVVSGSSGHFDSERGWTDDDYLVIKLDTDGNQLFERRLGDDSYQNAGECQITGASEIVVAGNFGGSLPLGTTYLSSPGKDLLNAEAFLARLDASGEPRWAKPIGLRSIRSFAVDDNGHIAVGGWVYNSGDRAASNPARAGFLALYDENGERIAHHEFSRDVSVNALDMRGETLLAVGAFKGDLVVNGEFAATASATEAFVALFDLNGSLRRIETFDQGSSTIASSGVFGPGARVLLAGSISKETELPMAHLASAGERDAFLGLFTAP